jgi:hypothetical protein
VTKKFVEISRYMPLKKRLKFCRIHQKQCQPVNAAMHVSSLVVIRLSDNAVESLLEPLDGLGAVDAVRGTDGALASSSARDTLTGAGHAAVEIHAVDTDRRVVLDTEIDVLADTEAEVASLAEVALAQLVFLNLEATLENLLGLGAANGNVNGDLFVTSDTESSDGVTGLACNK